MKKIIDTKNTALINHLGKPITVLMLSPEFPPFITGGLGVACYGLVKALLKYSIRIYLILPPKDRLSEIGGPVSNHLSYFILQNPVDADTLGERIAIIKNTTGSETSGIISTPLPEIDSGSREDEDSKQNHLKNISKLFKGSPYGTYTYLHHSYILEEAEIYERYAGDVASALSFDIVHAHDWFTYPAGLRIKEDRRKPLICHVHSTEYDRRINNPNPEIIKIEGSGFKKSDKIIAVSEYTAKKIVEHYSVDSNKIEVVYNASPIEKKITRKAKIKTFRVSFVGRLTSQKDPIQFIKISRLILEKLGFPSSNQSQKTPGTIEFKIEFLMAGEGELKTRLERYIEQNKLKGYIKLTGFLERGEIEELLVNTDILLMPSISEPFGLVILEAMACGAVPVVPETAGAGELLQYVIKADYSDIKKITKIVIDLLKKPGKLRRLQEKCAGEARKIRWETSARKITKIYREVIKNPGCIQRHSHNRGIESC